MSLIIKKNPNNNNNKIKQSKKITTGRKNQNKPPAHHTFMSGKLEAFIVTFSTRKKARDDSGSSEAVS